VITWIKENLASSQKLLAAILALGVIGVVFAVGLMFVAGYLISASADNAFSLLMLNIPLAFVQIFGLGKPIARYFERLKSHDWVLRLTSHLRHQLFLVVQAHLCNDHGWKTGEVLGALASDIEHMQNLYLRTVFPVLIAWLAGVLLVVIAGVYSIGMFIFTLGMLVLLCVVIPLLSALLARARIKRTNDDRALLYSSVTDHVLGAQDIAIAGRGAETTRCFMHEFDRVRTEERVIERADRWRLLLIQVLLLMALIFIVWCTTNRFGAVAGGTADWIVAAAFGFFPLIELFIPLSREVEEGISHRESIKRCASRGLLDVASREATSNIVPKEPFDLRFKEISYYYDPDRLVLDDLSFAIPYAQKVAILGKSGSGKTTLAHLIHGDIEPTQGSVELGGVSLGELRDDIWNYIGLISQDSYVFAMSIMDNLRIGKIDATAEEAWRALDAVGLKTYVESLPEGLETIAHEAGLNFSGGQRQRLVLARVLLQDPPIVILDEPTVGLDPVTEQRILDAILASFEHKTLLMITHHLQGIDAFDRVMFLEKGTLVMDSTPALLAKNNERYRMLLAFDRGLRS
jgi:ATP-binding cassette subfamily C protein CydC